MLDIIIVFCTPTLHNDVKFIYKGVLDFFIKIMHYDHPKRSNIMPFKSVINT